MANEQGVLHLGRVLDPGGADDDGGALHVERGDLTTHGVIVGMTGSGKTGLGVVLLEEVLASGVPALILDPKGDMGNLALNFPGLRPHDFEPWVDDAEARREGMTRHELAERTAASWAEGLARSGIDESRMRALRDGVDIRILTPGSTAGIPMNMVGDLSAPDVSWDTHGETLRDEIEGLVSGLLIMADIEADPLTSREHILLSNLVEHAWRAGRTLDLPTLLGQIQTPPLRRLGVFEIDAFFPPPERMKLAMRLNGLVASPSFAEWLTGEPADIDALLHAPDGRPRASIVYLAHLSESERQFVVTLLLSRLITWMRRQSGTSDLRAMLYADEVVGFAPPTANPPTKKPLLTLFKQARAHGVGLVLSTQNPVDLDYKLMSNAGTWMIGRLQTERDKARIIEGLRSVSGEVDVDAWDARIGQLGKREFLLKSTRSAAPTLFTTRWAMSFLRGPMTRAELLLLGGEAGGSRSGPEGGGGPAASPTSARTEGAASAASDPGALAADESPVLPTVADGVPVKYLDPAAPWATELGVNPSGRRLEPGLAARVRMLFDERVGDLRHEQEWEAVFFPLPESFDIAEARTVDYDDRDFRDRAPGGAIYALVDAPLDRSSWFTSARRDIQDGVYRQRTLELFRNETLGEYSRPGQSRERFVERCLALAEDRADEEAEKLRDRFESRLDTARRRLAQAERRVRELDQDVAGRRQQEMVAGAGDVLSMFLGGRRRVRSLSGMSSRRSRTRRTEERLRSAAEKAADYQDDIAELEDDLADELAEIWARWKAAAEDVGPFEVSLEKNDVRVADMVLFWAPMG